MEGDYEIRIAALSACLSLVRPVGMTEAETVDWLDVAADTLAHIPAHILDRGARAARAKCTHHAQIVPTIVAETRDALELYNRPKGDVPLRLVAPEPQETLPAEPLPDPETLPVPLRRIGLSKGWIIERNGRLEWAEGDAA